MIRLEPHGISRGPFSLGDRFVPFDAITGLEGAKVLVGQGRKFSVSADLQRDLARVLAGPTVAATREENARSLREYLSAPFSAERACRALLEMASRAGATDVHLEALESAWAVRLRVAGALIDFTTVDGAAGQRLVAALKHLSGCQPWRRDLLQEGRISRAGVAADVRLSFVPTPLGERVALRLFGRLLALDALGLTRELYARLVSALGAPHGLLIVAGPSGAGKTTTLYSALAHLAAARSGAHLSIEDPVEQRLRAAGVPVDQLELSKERGLDGEAALAAALRQDVDVLAVGEVRSSAEALLALKAAHTGRLVLAGLHAGSVDEARLRLLELGCDGRVLENTLVAVLHQRLDTVPCAAHAPASCVACGGAGQRRALTAQLWTKGATA